MGLEPDGITNFTIATFEGKDCLCLKDATVPQLIILKKYQNNI
jgi:hypothetical protein